MNPQRETLLLVEQQEAALSKYGFTHNAIVRLATHQLPRVNTKPLKKLSNHGFIVLLVLAEQAIENPGAYVSTEALVRAIKSRERRLGDMGMSWVEPTVEEMHKAACQIRLALKKAGIDDSLLEGLRGQGYRLSTPLMNIIIDQALRIFDNSGKNTGMIAGNLLE